ncbi:MAG: transporter substrate-binding domain-containing protein [Chloroflexi bacterium]|nr:transporter substrate-binding domain-containing protein [Chloroflexota bacterium]
MITATSLSAFIRMLLLGTLCLCSVLNAAGGEESGSCADDTLDFGFYAFFDPVSYSADEDTESEGFHRHLGYEADLLTALEAMGGAGLTFFRHPIPVFDDIWLQSATPEYDIVGGGITILDSRTRDATGQERVIFTSGHIIFRQSLLMRAEDAERMNSYDKLSSDWRVGALSGTTGEFRLLELTGLVDETGVLAAGAQVDTPLGTVIADGSDDYVITPAGESPSLAERSALHPPADRMPQVIYLGHDGGENELIAALHAKTIDAFARGDLGNQAAAHASDGSLVVAARDDKIEYGGFTVDIDNPDLAACLDEKINWLTDDRRIGFSEWVADPAVFTGRAELWNERRAPAD